MYGLFRIHRGGNVTRDPQVEEIEYISPTSGELVGFLVPAAKPLTELPLGPSETGAAAIAAEPIEAWVIRELAVPGPISEAIDLGWWVDGSDPIVTVLTQSDLVTAGVLPASAVPATAIC